MFEKVSLRVTACILFPLLVLQLFCVSSFAVGDALVLTPTPDAVSGIVTDATAEKEATSADNKLQESVPIGEPGFDPDCKSCVLMEASTGRILYAKNEDEALPPASVTKIMTLLLVMEAIDSGKLGWEDMVTASAHACSMGGSQIYLKENERMSVRDLVKSVVIASANDAAVALAEHLMGSEAAFVSAMNRRATELGMEHTNFENTNGLDDTAQNHKTSAEDIALMSRALIAHEQILEFSSTWMDSVRDGAFGLTNTNRLVRFYNGCNGLKTGSTAKAGFCVSATAQRDGMTLICVIMGAATRDIRNQTAASLLDWGFSAFELYRDPAATTEPIDLRGGKEDTVVGNTIAWSCVLPKGDAARIERRVEVSDSLYAPIEAGDAIGQIVYVLDGRELARTDILAAKTVARIGFFEIFVRMLADFLLI